PRPIMSAPRPRRGSSGRYGQSGSSPKTVRTASPMSVPGRDPMPVATPAGSAWSATGGAFARARGGVLGHGVAGGVDGAGAQDRVAAFAVRVVDDQGLSGGHAVGGLVESRGQAVGVGGDGGRVDLAVGAQLHFAFEGTGGLGAEPHGRAGADPVDAQRLAGSDLDAVVDRGDRQDVAGPAVGGGPLEAQSVALADGELMGAVVAAQDLSGGGVDDVAGGGAEPVLEEP